MFTTLAVLLLTQATDAEVVRWHRAVGLLEYIQGDYRGAVDAHDDGELKEQQGLANEVILTLEQLGEPAAQFLPEARALKHDIDTLASAERVENDSRRLSEWVVTSMHLTRAPSATPSLENGSQVYQTNCARCHGLDGKADTPIAQALKPQPANFHSADRMASVTPYKVFNTTRFGVPQTSMVPLPDLSDDERWDVSFFVQSLRQATCDTDKSAPSKASLEELATLNDRELQAKHPETSLACLRRVFPTPDSAALTTKAVAGIDAALTLFRQADFDQARQRLVDVYLNDIEPLEPALKVKSPEKLKLIEAAFTAAREAAEAKTGFEAPAQALKTHLTSLGETRSTGDFWSVLVAALLILLREGFEATVVVGALLAVLKKMNAVNHARVVHLGWISALAVGALLFIFAERFFAGANREWMESLVALAAVAMLIYAALWLNARATMSHFMNDMRGKMKDALTNGSAAGLFLISFSSVARESIETVLFLQGLSADSRSGVVWGTVAGLALLLGLVIFVRTVGFVLPMKTLFSASTVLLLATSVMLLGKGLHGLQELDIVHFRPVPFFELPMFGIFPDWLTLSAQLLLATALTLFMRWPRAKRAPSTVSTSAVLPSRSNG